MSDINDALVQLSKLALNADPRARDRDKMRKVLNYKIKDDKNLQIIRCVCKHNNMDNREKIRCIKCLCLLHTDCIETDDSDNYTCPFCEENDPVELTQYVEDIHDFHKSIFLTRGSRYTKLVQSAENIYNINNRIDKCGTWIKALIARDDIYANLVTAGNSCMKDSDAENLSDELSKERNVLDDIANKILNINNELSSLNHPVTDILIKHIMTYSKNTVEPMRPQNFENTQEEEE